MFVVWSQAGAQFFHNLPVPAGFLQRAARVLYMTIVIAGGTGFLGSPLAEMYAEDGNEVRVLTRSLPSGERRHDPGTGVPGISRVGCTPDGGSGAWSRALEGADAVINLSGESLASTRWSARAKTQFRDSRILATRSLATAIKAAAVAPARHNSRRAGGRDGPAGEGARNPRDAPAAAAPSASTDRPTIERSPNVTHQAPVFSQSCASSGSKRRVKPSGAAPVSSFCELESCSSVRAVRCRR